MAPIDDEPENSSQKAIAETRSSIQTISQTDNKPDFSVPVPNISYRETRVSIPEEKSLEKNRVISSVVNTELSDIYRLLRTRILYRMDAFGFKSIAITSPNRAAGKTQTAVNLALSLAMNTTRTVLLIDTDMRSPAIHKLVGIAAEPGLQDFLLNDASLSSCLVNPGVERLVILPLAYSLPGSSELLASPKMISLTQELAKRYPERIIIYDLPPLLYSADALIFLRYVDCCLLVADEGGTRKNELVQSLSYLEQFNLIGTVYNKTSEIESIRYK